MRIEKDSMGEVQVPDHVLYGAQTQRAVENFQISGHPLPEAFLQALVEVKKAAAITNAHLGLMSDDQARAIVAMGDVLLAGQHWQSFPLDVYQTGSGTSTNMNMNEVLVNLCRHELGMALDANDHINMSQSSNDVIPTALAVMVVSLVEKKLNPAIEDLIQTIRTKAKATAKVTKTGRTHLMDAMPITLGQELTTWAEQLRDALDLIHMSLNKVRRLPIGGTAVGTGINAPEGFAQGVCDALSQSLATPFVSLEHKFVAMSAQDGLVSLSGQLKTMAVALYKIANDLRWMNSGPLAGLAEIALPALQPGSSIMPGKVNPVISEAVMMATTQVIGLDTANSMAGASGNFQLNVALPLLAWNLNEMVQLLSTSAEHLANKSISGFVVNQVQIDKALATNPILITALNRVIGYQEGAKIAKKAYETGRPLLEIALENTNMSEQELKTLLDPYGLTQGGVPR